MDVLYLCDGIIIAEVDMDSERVFVGDKGVNTPDITVHIVLAGDSNINDARIQKHLLQFVQTELWEKFRGKL